MTFAPGDERPPTRVALAGANVLYSRILRDYLLYDATQGVLDLRWSAEILHDVVEHLADHIAGFDAAAGARLVAAMNDAFPSAEVEPDPDADAVVEEFSLPDEDDRCVLAAAVAVSADVLCTDNLKDFPAEVTDAIGVRLMSADALLSLLVAEFPDRLVATHRLTVLRLPGASDASVLAALRRARAVRTADLMVELLAS